MPLKNQITAEQVLAWLNQDEVVLLHEQQYGEGSSESVKVGYLAQALSTALNGDKGLIEFYRKQIGAVAAPVKEAA